MSLRDRITLLGQALARQILCTKGGIVLGRVTGAGEAEVHWPEPDSDTLLIGHYPQ